MGQELELETPQIDAIIEWVQELRGERYIEDGRLLVDEDSLAGPFRSGIPPVYGVDTVEGVVD